MKQIIIKIKNFISWNIKVMIVNHIIHSIDKSIQRLYKYLDNNNDGIIDKEEIDFATKRFINNIKIISKINK
jgi:superfamily II DNA or RNA helicase